MRWFKHLSNAKNDLTMQDLIANFGYEGYGLYWAIIEILAENLNGGEVAEAKLPIKRWCNSGAISAKKFHKICEFLSSNGNFSYEICGKYATIRCHKISKYRDEYTKKKERISGHCPE